MSDAPVLIALEKDSHPDNRVTLELVFEDTHVRLRVREPSGKASIFLDADDLTLLADQALLMRERLPQVGRPPRPRHEFEAYDVPGKPFLADFCRHCAGSRAEHT